MEMGGCLIKAGSHLILLGQGHSGVRLLSLGGGYVKSAALDVVPDKRARFLQRLMATGASEAIKRAKGPSNNEMHLTRSAMANRRGPRR
jgi:hypothetical protein